MFTSRRSPVLSCHGCVACTNPLAAEIGLTALKSGGNAADAAVAVAAALNVTEPFSTGIGGDCFCLFYEAATRRVHGINGSGRAPSKLTLELLSCEGYNHRIHLPKKHAHTVTVPGAAAGWVDTVERFGSGNLSLSEVLAPAIKLAEEGFPVQLCGSHLWQTKMADLMVKGNIHGCDLLLEGVAPKIGEIMAMPHLASTFKLLAEHGKAGFYEGKVANAIVECVQRCGGVMTLEDLRDHQSTFDQPIKTTYRGVDIWEMPPNGQGITTLLALNILEGFDFSKIPHNSPEYLHLLIEALQLSFADSLWYCADPNMTQVPLDHLLSKQYAVGRRDLIDLNKCLLEYHRGSPFQCTDTVYFCVTDEQGNACSFINSNYMGFGTGLVPRQCGFTLQNRGHNFSLDPNHPNCLAPCKRPYHTIIPGMATYADGGDLYGAFGVMGGFMQPQGHVQVLLNMIDYGMNPQEALDAPRFCITDSEGISIEDGISSETLKALRTIGHCVKGPVVGLHERSLFGRGQIICSRPIRTRDVKRNVWWAGSDGRADGMAIGY